MLNLTIVDCV